MAGHLWKLTFTDGAEAKVFIPEHSQSSPPKFKALFDSQYVDIRMKLRVNSAPAWNELVEDLIDAAERKAAGCYPKLYFMEKVGFQDHTVSLTLSIKIE